MNNGYVLSRKLLPIAQPWRSLLKFLSLFSLCFALTVGCGGNSQSTSPVTTNSAVADSNRVSIGTTLRAETLDPADAYEIFPGILLYNMGDRLYTYTPGTAELEPQLATAMPEISDDGLTYTIPLREGVTFHDGTPFNAEAMAFSIQRFMENGGRPSFLLSDQIESVEATGEYELTITLQQPFAAFTSILAFWGVTPVSPAAYEIGEGSFSPNTFVGTGPYKLASFGTDSISLDVNEDYWGDAPANEGVDIQIISSPANLFNTFRTGGLDIAYQTLDPDQIRTLVDGAQDNDWQVIEAGTNTVNYLVLNQRSEPFDDVRVRQAIAALVNRNLLLDRVFQGQAEPLYSLLPNTFPVYKPVFQEEFGDGNTEKAGELLAEAGFSEANPLTLEIWHSSTSTVRGLVASTLKASIEQQLPGIVNVDIQTAESATLFGNLGDGVYPSVLLDWYPDFYDEDTFVYPFLACDEGSETTGCESGQTQEGGSFYYRDRVKELVAEQRLETDETNRDNLIIELQELAAEDAPYVPLWQNKDYVFARSGVEGVEVQPTQQVLFWQIQK
ncbi:ABC transporter substrate-binding protein [Egbenema bharatensis]|uniref:ABC transporter substrate-binding protein n=1 Tax=Egbenema bharatensis TaxID=3463334 RepID=UPI003A858E89